MPFDAAHLHLMVNHFPVVLSIVGMASLAVGAVTRRDFYWRAGLILMVLAAIAAGVAILTGESASDEIRQRAFVVRGTIGAHSSAAYAALWALLVAGVISGYAWWSARAREVMALPAWLRELVLILALVGASLVSYAAYRGGIIVYDAPVLQTLRAPSAP
ncbi:MAG: DUF2231 domain-containing protein [Gemmatimonadaceae bacterium]|nr:DUF2231 domain-containing protein [Gemmatimonadaceae bacterium]